MILYLSVLALFLTIQDKTFFFLISLIVAAAVAAAAESLIVYFKKKVFSITESSIITGMIVGYVVSSDEPLWKISAAALCAVASKHILRFRDKHIFNPAACGIFLAMVVLGASTEWRATYLSYVVVPCGIYFAYRIKKIPVVIGYAAVFLVLFGAQALWQRTNFFNIFGYLSYFYIFVMVIEPKTTPIHEPAKYIFGAGVAALIFILTQAGVRFDAELFSLFVMNAATPFLDKAPIKTRRKT